MKIATPLLLIFSITIPTICQTMETEGGGSAPRLQITAETLAQHEEAFRKFIQELEETKWPKLKKLPDPDTSWVGWAVVGVANKFLTVFTRYGEVRPKETGVFLGRVFETPSAKGRAYQMPALLQQGFQSLTRADHNQDYINYVSGVLNQLTQEELKRRDLARLAEVMELEKRKYPTMPGSKNMSNKTEVPDETFAPFAVAQLFTTFCVENKLLLTDERGSRHPHSRSAKLQSATTES